MDSNQLPNIPDNLSQQFSSALKRAQEIAQKLRSNAPNKLETSTSTNSSTLAKVHQIASSISSKHNISGPSNLDENEEVNDSMLIPASVAGLVIGKGGETIRMLQERAQCRMFMVQDGIYASGPDKLLTFGGSRIRVEEAKKLVKDFLDDKEGTLKGIPNLSPGWVRNELTVPRESVGLIIGRGGETIKKINVDTNCRVYFRVLDNNTPGDRVCIFEGLPEDIENAVMRVREIVALALRKNGIRIQQILLPDGYSIEEIPIKSQKANLIITRNNEYIKSVIAATGANIELNKGIDSTISRNFIVFGLPNQIKHVRDMFEDRVGAENVFPSVQPTNCQIQRIPNQMNNMANPMNNMANQMNNMGGYHMDPMMQNANPYDPNFAAMNPHSAYPDSMAMNNSMNAPAVDPYNQANPSQVNPYNNTNPAPETDVNNAWNAYYAQMNQQQQQPAANSDEVSSAWASYYSQLKQQAQAEPTQSATFEQPAWNAENANPQDDTAATGAQVTVEQATAWADYYDQVHQQNLAQGGDPTLSEQALAWAKYYRDMIPLLTAGSADHPTIESSTETKDVVNDYVDRPTIESSTKQEYQNDSVDRPNIESSTETKDVANDYVDHITIESSKQELEDPQEPTGEKDAEIESTPNTNLVEDKTQDAHPDTVEKSDNLTDEPSPITQPQTESHNSTLENEINQSHNSTLGNEINQSHNSTLGNEITESHNSTLENEITESTDIPESAHTDSDAKESDIKESDAKESDTKESDIETPNKARRTSTRNVRKRKAEVEEVSNENECDQNEPEKLADISETEVAVATTPGKGRGRRGRPAKKTK